MATTKHPYVTAIGWLDKTIAHLRSSFPPIVDSGVLKKLGFAPNNESYVINVLRFLKVIDADGAGTGAAKAAFLQHDDAAFQRQFGELVQSSYAALFDLHGDGAWEQTLDSLIQFFRTTDSTTGVVGRLQAKTFMQLSQLAGHGAPTSRARKGTPDGRPSKESKTKKVATVAASRSAPPPERAKPQMGLTVRIEINLPADGSQETYDRIFKSIRENFIDG